MRWNETKVNSVSAIGIGLVMLSLPFLPYADAPEAQTPPALIDTREGTYIVYPSVLPECDEEDGTATVDSLPVAACKWDDGTGTPFIVIAPLP